jgi:hypothetical protein
VIKFDIIFLNASEARHLRTNSSYSLEPVDFISNSKLWKKSKLHCDTKSVYNLLTQGS